MSSERRCAWASDELRKRITSRGRATSRTWRDSVEVNAFTSSGMIAPAAVPQVITADSFHHIEESPAMLGIIR